ncbi:putative zinc ribbon protein [Klebsiella michiganensis]
MKHCYRCQTGIYGIEDANWQKILSLPM